MPEYFYVYPAYLSKHATRSLGRRVPAADAPAEVSAEAIVEAARILGYEAQGEPGKQYPRQFYLYAGRVKVTKKPGISKAQFLKDLARVLKSRPHPR